MSEHVDETTPPGRARRFCRYRGLKSVHLGSIKPNNGLPLLAFRKRLIEGEVAPESSTASVAPTSEASETTAARGIRKTACRPISAAKNQQILSLKPTGISAREIAVRGGVTESTGRAHLHHSDDRFSSRGCLFHAATPSNYVEVVFKMRLTTCDTTASGRSTAL